MAAKVALGIQYFDDLRERNCFYVDKTDFIREWWENNDDVTLITRPRRFGKTLNMSMLNCFFSNKYEGRKDLFKGLSIAGNDKMMALLGTYPVIFLSFATIKENNFKSVMEQFKAIFSGLYVDYSFLMEGNVLDKSEKEYFRKIKSGEISELLSTAVSNLTKYLWKYYGKKVIIILDEYDTPMQEAYLNGYWDEAVSFMRNLFNSSFKTNPCLERAVMTGITRVSKESLFSDFNNLKVITMTSKEYSTAFGFVEKEVFDALDAQGMADRKDEVRKWYDGFKIGDTDDIYNPWSILNFLRENELKPYWVNTSSNGLVGKLIRESDTGLKEELEMLLRDEILDAAIDEEIIFSQLDTDPGAVWSLLLAAGYLKAEYARQDPDTFKFHYGLSITNLETKIMFWRMIEGWFRNYNVSGYDPFLKAFLSGNLDEMNAYMGMLCADMISSFDGGKKSSGKSQPERFYHGFVLGLLVDLRADYTITSNRESGLGRYDVVIAPKFNRPGAEERYAYVIEFKVFDPSREKTLGETVKRALKQIEEKQYDVGLLAQGIAKERIKHYGFAFEGKTVKIGGIYEEI